MVFLMVAADRAYVHNNGKSPTLKIRGTSSHNETKPPPRSFVSEEQNGD
jgi:hypothetical protein